MARVIGDDKWNGLFERLKRLPVHQEIFVPNCKPIPEHLCEKTWLGWPRGADEQYRCRDNVHIRWFRDGNWCLAHKDRVDPRKDPLGHLLCDVSSNLLSDSMRRKLCYRQK